MTHISTRAHTERPAGHAGKNQTAGPAAGLPARALCTFITTLVLGWAASQGSAMAGPAQTASVAERLHAEAVKSFRLHRFPEAYGRFVSLADAGHAPSARVALLMCEHGRTLFGHDWDCAPHQVEAWAAAAGLAAPTIGVQPYVQPKPVLMGGGRR